MRTFNTTRIEAGVAAVVILFFTGNLCTMRQSQMFVFLEFIFLFFFGFPQLRTNTYRSTTTCRQLLLLPFFLVFWFFSCYDVCYTEKILLLYQSWCWTSPRAVVNTVFLLSTPT